MSRRNCAANGELLQHAGQHDSICSMSMPITAVAARGQALLKLDGFGPNLMESINF
jgi:hypothetical protein